jgi:hypothetical protein
VNCSRTLAGLNQLGQPSHMGRVEPGPKNKKNLKNSLQKYMIFRKYFTAF